LFLVGSLFPYINDAARSNSHQICIPLYRKTAGFPTIYFLHLEILSLMNRKLKFKASKYNIKRIRIHA